MFVLVMLLHTIHHSSAHCFQCHCSYCIYCKKKTPGFLVNHEHLPGLLYIQKREYATRTKLPRTISQSKRMPFLRDLSKQKLEEDDAAVI